MKVSPEYLTYIVQSYLINKNLSIYNFTITQIEKNYFIFLKDSAQASSLAAHIKTDFESMVKLQDSCLEINSETANLLCENFNNLSISIQPGINPEVALGFVPKKIILSLNNGESIFKFYFKEHYEDISRKLEDLNLIFSEEVKDKNYMISVSVDLEKTPTLDLFLESITNHRTLKFH